MNKVNRSRVPSVPSRPYTLLSCAISVDGCLDDTSADRLILSGPQDLDEVDELRAASDAILVGAGTLTATARLDPSARFFTGPGTALVYCASPAAAAARARLGEAAVVIDAGDPPSLRTIFADLYSERSVATLLVEGGSLILRDALAEDLADELRLAVAPFFVGQPAAPRFGLPAAYPHTAANPMTLAAARRLGDTAVLHYRLSSHERPSFLPPLPPSPALMR
jgi:5-amino-6-(5-phosphoribosylamino)uracil reductase